MNLLAHLYLSDGSESIMLGNFIADFIRGNRFEHLPEGVITGIKLHRAIDDFTDNHEEVKKSIHYLRESFGRYSGVVLDVYYDFFLARNWTHFHHESLSMFTQKAYQMLNHKYHLLPELLKDVLPTMIEEDWLLNYGNIQGLERTFSGLTKRIDNKQDLNFAPAFLTAHIDYFKESFDTFFPDLIEHVKNYRMILI